MRIERKYSRPGGTELAWRTKLGYQLADPRNGPERHHAKYAIYVQTLEEAADRIEHLGYSIRMGRKGLPASLVTPDAVSIIR